MSNTAGSDGTDPISERDDQLYRACLQSGPLSIDDLAALLQWDDATVQQHVTRLLRLGLVGDSDGRINALPPRAAMYGLAADLESTAVEVRGRAAGWSALWQRYREGAPSLEVLETESEERAADNGLLRSARRQIRGLQVGPIRSPVGPRPVQVPDAFFDATNRGVRFRMVYGVDILRDPEGLAAVQSCIAVGEEARVFPDVPLNLSIADDRLALLSASSADENPRQAVVVHPSGLLTALISLFESYWRMGVPVSADEPALGRSSPDQQGRQLLAYLAAGLTDESIARELGVSERTVGRRVARLQERLGAGSRFQLGVQATRRGWI
jgi:DNA-binding CsgD family transcriptional regulator